MPAYPRCLDRLPAHDPVKRLRLPADNDMEVDRLTLHNATIILTRTDQG